MHPDRGAVDPAAGEVRGEVARAKEVLRARLLAARRALSGAELAAAREAVAGVVLASLRTGDAVVAAYEPLRTEPGSVELLAALVASGREVVVPVTLPDRDLSWVRWQPPSRGGRPGVDLGVAAVARADVVLVPALAVCAADGARLGRGGGSYDRALRRARGRTVALLHRGELLPAVPVDDHDVAVDAAVTPDGWTAVEGRAIPPR